MAIHDRGQVTPLAAHLEVGDIGDPDLIGAFDRDRMCPAFHAGQEPGQARALAVDSRRTGANPVFAHQSLDPTPARGFPALAQERVDARTPIGLATVRMRGADLVHEAGVFHGTRARRPRGPGVVARGTDAQHPAHPPHRVRFLVVPDEGEDVAFRAEVNAMAFFKRSCSSFSRS